MTKNKRMVSLVLTLAMILSMGVGALGNALVQFTDIDNHWATSALQNAVANGLLQGDNGKIRPNDNLSRAEMATIVNRAFGATEKASISHYPDVLESAWYHDDMAKAVKMGTFVGDGNKLNPDNSITREEAFVALARAFKLSGANESSLNIFLDKEEVSAWAKDGVASLVSEGYIAGSNDKLNPKQSITRAEFAQVMDNLIKTYINKEGTYDIVNDGNVMVNVANVILKNLTVNGDLIIGDGVGDGDITLENVIVTGRTVIRGGGENSIRIIGNSNIQNIVIARVDGVVRVFAEDGTEVGEVIVDGNDNVIVEGSIGTVTVVAADIVVSANNSTIENINISGPNSEVIVSEGSKVDNITVDANQANVEVLGEVRNINTTTCAEQAVINVSERGRVEQVEVNGQGTKIDGEGKVQRVEAKANDVEINTPDTKVTAGEGIIGVIADGKEVEPGTTLDPTPSPGPVYPGPVAVTGISVSPETMILKVGEEGTITATVAPSNATNKNVTWISSDETVATVDGNGVVTGIKGGTATITVTSVANSNIKATIQVIIGDLLVPASGNNIQQVIDKAQDGQVIAVGAGTFNEALTIGKSLTIFGVDGTIVTGGAIATTTEAGKTLTISGIEFRTAGDHQ